MSELERISRPSGPNVPRPAGILRLSEMASPSRTSTFVGPCAPALPGDRLMRTSPLGLMAWIKSSWSRTYVGARLPRPVDQFRGPARCRPESTDTIVIRSEPEPRQHEAAAWSEVEGDRRPAWPDGGGRRGGGTRRRDDRGRGHGAPEAVARSRRGADARLRPGRVGRDDDCERDDSGPGDADRDPTRAGEAGPPRARPGPHPKLTDRQHDRRRRRLLAKDVTQLDLEAVIRHPGTSGRRARPRSLGAGRDRRAAGS